MYCPNLAAETVEVKVAVEDNNSDSFVIVGVSRHDGQTAD